MSKNFKSLKAFLSILILLSGCCICLGDITQSLGQAGVSYKTGDYRQAEQICQDILRQHKRDDYAFEAQKSLSNLYILVEKNTEAQVAIDKLITDFSGNAGLPSVLYEITSIYCWTKKYQQAENIYQRIIQNRPGSEAADKAKLELAKLDILALIDAQADSQAQIEIDNLITDFSGHSCLAEGLYGLAQVYEWSGTKYQQAKGVYQRLIKNCPGSSFAAKAQIDIYKVEALSAVDAGEVSKARTEIDKLKAADFSGRSYLPEALYAIATRCEWTAKNYVQAKELYQYIAQQYPASWCADKAQLDVLKADISVYIESGNDSAAQSTIKQLIADFHGNSYLAEVLYHIATRYEQAGNYAGAKDAYELVALQNPDAWHAIRAELGIHKAGILQLLAAGDNTGGFAALDRFIADYPGNSHLTWVIAEMAEYPYKEAFELEERGLTAQAKDSFQKALTIWEKVVSKLPGDPYTVPYAYSCMGDCYSRLDEYEKSIQCYQFVADNYPEHFLAWNGLYLVGRNYQDLGKSGAISQLQADSQTASVYQQLVSTYPNCPAARIAGKWLSKHNTN